MSKYSNWLKIDLHIHTDFSKKTKENDYIGDFSVVELHKKLTENKVEIFSLTDHNIINVKAYSEYYEKYSSEKDPLLLIGVELDVLRISTDGAKKIYHSLIVFNYSSKEKVEEINKRLENKYKQKSQEDKQRTLTLDEIATLFPTDEFFFCPHAGNTKSIKTAYSDDIEEAQRTILLMESSALEKVPAKTVQKYNEGFDKINSDTFKNKNNVAYLEFSDNHNISLYPCVGKGYGRKEHTFYYIKGSKSYETLRLACIDPESRIKSTEEFKELNKQSKIIEKLKILPQQLLEEKELSFSPHLNVIIGGRSSGKSLLLDVFSRKIAGIENDKTKYNNVEIDKILIKSNLDSDYIQRTTIGDGIVYINQGDIVRYFEENKLEDLATKAGKDKEYEQHKMDFKDLKTNLEGSINSLKLAYKSAYNCSHGKKYILHKLTLENALSDDVIIKFNYENLCEKYDQTYELDSSFELINEIKEKLADFTTKDILEINEIDKHNIDTFLEFISTKEKLLNTKKDLWSKQKRFLDRVEDKITEKTNLLDASAQSKTQANVDIAELKRSIKEVFSTMNELKEYSRRLEEYDFSLSPSIKLNDKVSLALYLHIEEKITELLADGINKSDIPLENISMYKIMLLLIEDKISIKNFDSTHPDSLNKKMDKQLSALLGSLDKPKDCLKYSDGSTSENNTPGYNSEKYLEIILNSQDNKIIFIDQPEDNLGNVFIAKNLVQILRAIKFKKQIFLVTHNPAIVVYGDAENIIVAENDKNKISYEQIVLEERVAQKKICEILDGGEHIFYKRSQKYNIKRILKEGEIKHV